MPQARPTSPSKRGSRLGGVDPDVERWLGDLTAQRKSRYTVKHYGLTLRQFQDWLRATYPVRRRLADVTASELKQYQIVASTQRGYAKNTLYIHLKAIQAFYRHLERDDLAKALRPPRRAQGLPKYLTEAEASRLLQAATSPRVRAILALLLYTGMRVGELVRVQAPDLDVNEGTLRVRSGKGDKDRLVIVPPAAMEPLVAWLGQRPSSTSDYVFPGRGRGPLAAMTVQRAVARTADAAGLTKRVTPHVLRHTLATTLLRRGGDIRFIQRILGHASIATTQIYTHLDDAELKRMYERAQPQF